MHFQSNESGGAFFKSTFSISSPSQNQRMKEEYPSDHKQGCFTFGLKMLFQIKILED